jgi:hypothetical protein
VPRIGLGVSVTRSGIGVGTAYVNVVAADIQVDIVPAKVTTPDEAQRD